MEDNRPIIAVDLDEVLSNTLVSVIEFHNHTYGTSLKLSDFETYNYWETWGGTKEESIERIRIFYGSPFYDKCSPLPFSFDVCRVRKKTKKKKQKKKKQK